MIERHYPNLPKIDLFCRGVAAPGWHAFGNEAIQAHPDFEITGAIESTSPGLAQSDGVPGATGDGLGADVQFFVSGRP
jgi:hypothetical protein